MTNIRDCFSMNNILIHIGYHKTATTWLQKELFIEDNSVFLPLSRDKYKQSTFAIKFILGDDGYLLSPFNNNENAIKREYLYLLKDKKNIDEKVLVVSSERLCGNYRSAGFDSKIIAHRINNMFKNARIFISIREQKSFVLSSYLQYLSRGGIYGIEKFLNRRFDYQMPTFSPHHIDYVPLIKEYQLLFGKENVLVLPYEIFRDFPDVFIQHIGNFIDQDIVVDNQRFKEKYNTKENPFLLYKFRLMNLFLFCNSSNFYSSLHNPVSKKMASLFLKLAKFFVSSKLNQKAKDNLSSYIDGWAGDRYEKSNKELSKLIDMDLSLYGYHRK